MNRKTTAKSLADEILGNLREAMTRQMLDAIASEREACASLADEIALRFAGSPVKRTVTSMVGEATAIRIARAIRSRSSSPAPTAAPPVSGLHGIPEAVMDSPFSGPSYAIARLPQDAPPSAQPTSPTPNPPEGQESGVDASK